MRLIAREESIEKMLFNCNFKLLNGDILNTCEKDDRLDDEIVDKFSEMVQ